MDAHPFSAKILSTVLMPPKGKPTIEIDKASSHNAASCMTVLLCSRLATQGKVPRIVSRTTFHWDDGIINIRNAVQPYLWTNLRLNWVEEFHASAASLPAVYLMACWQPGEETLHVWAIPESVMYDAVPRHPVRQVKEKRTVQIKPNVQRFEQCEESPDLQPYYRALKLSVEELGVLNAGYKTDTLVKLDRKRESEAVASETSEAVVKTIPQSVPQTAPTTNTVSERKRYWAIGLGEGGRLWNECQEKGIVAIGWDELGDLREYASQEAIADKLRSGRTPGAPEPVNDSLACFEFCQTMAPGDYVVAKIGLNKLLGIGSIQSEYIFEPNRSEYHHVRRVNWLRAVNMPLPAGAWVPAKTLTDVTNYTTFVTFVRENLLAEARMAEPPIDEVSKFTVNDAMAGLFIPRTEVEAILSALRRKKNVVLQGPPGVGKTFVAKRIAFALMGQEDKNRVEMVQFHQSYAYEDFVQGYRPSETGGFQIRDGIFYSFCNRARIDRDRDYVFIIDEINRGNLSKIFGELMMLIEHDKRGPAHTIPLTYSVTSGERFSVPENVHILGLMNTADRSLALVDYALRRRFVFFDIQPQFGSDFSSFLRNSGAPPALVERIGNCMKHLNGVICKDEKNLGRGFQIGHSYFCPPASTPQDFDWEGWFRSVVEWEIEPLLREYWFDNLPRARKQAEELLK